MEQNIINNSKKLVIKIGSSTLTSEDGSIDRVFLENLAYQVSELMKVGKRVVLVSSGARIAGLGTLGKWSRKEDIHYKQALCAIGQVELMDAYRRIFNKYGIHIGQLLLTKEDFSDKSRTLNIRNTLFTLLDEGVLPIINENDTVCVEEIKIGDNDMLAAHTTILWGADLLLILSDIEGIYDKNPTKHKDAKLIRLIENIDEIEKSILIEGKSSFGTGGIETKILAAKEVTGYGASLIVAKGKKENIILSLAKGEEKASLFLSK